MLKLFGKDKAPRLDIAAFQMEAVHEEIGSGFFRVFDELGLASRGYFNKRIEEARGDFYQTVHYENLEMTYPPMEGRPAWDAIASNVIKQNPKLLYFNTLQRGGVARWAEQFGKPILAVVHNPILFERSEPCRDLARAGKLDAFGLAPHVVASLEARIPELRGRVHLHNPFAWMPEGADRYEANPDTLSIIVPGAVVFTNRDFLGLISYLKSGEAEKQRPFRIVIVGGGSDRQRLDDIIADEKLEPFFDLAPVNPVTRRVPHKAYLERLYRSHVVLALLPPGRMDYLRTKITTGIVAALGTGRPIITTRQYGDAYGFTPLEVPEDRPFAFGLADLSPGTLAHRRAESLAIRVNGIHNNRASLKRVLERILA